MRKIYAIVFASLGLFVICFYIFLFIGEKNIELVRDEKLNFEKTVSILGEPDQSEESLKQVPGCGVGSRSIHYYYSRTALILRFEDTVSIVFDVNGDQCAFVRSSI